MTVNPREFIRFRLSLERGDFKNINPKSYEYDTIWKDQLDKCVNGISIGGVRMSGRLYAYVNFGTIEVLEEGNTKIKKGKVKGAPHLRDVEWLVFGYIEEAIKQSKNLMWISGRRGGKSYIGSFLSIYEFLFNPIGKSIIGAFDSKKVLDCLDKAKEHLDSFQTTPFKMNLLKSTHEITAGWMEKNDAKQWISKGLGRSVSHVNFKNNDTAANGKSCNFFYFEEVGMFNNLIDAYNAATPCWKEGTYSFGWALLAGTGGDMEAGSIDAQKMFNEPDIYNLLAFSDDDKERTTKYYIPPLPYEFKRSQGANCGFFLPATMVLNQYKDENGFTDVEGARQYLIEEREKLLKASQLTAYYNQMQYYPFTIDEAFLAGTTDIFPTALLQRRCEELMEKGGSNAYGVRGSMIIEEGKEGKETALFEANDKMKQVSFPMKQGEDKTGCVVIYEHPYRDTAGDIPSKLYIAGCDPYTQDQADTTTSLGSTIIYKRLINSDETHYLIVAEYVGRPLTAENFYEQTRRLLMYYNALCLYENNVPGLKPYFERKKSLRYLAEQPDITKELIERSDVKRQYGINMSAKVKFYMLERIKSWLLEERGEGLCNIDKILSLNLLKELINYNDKGNFDRVISLGLVMIQEDEMYRIKPKTTIKKDSFSELVERVLVINRNDVDLAKYYDN